MLRRVKRGDELYHINSVVDVNNLISVESGSSMSDSTRAMVTTESKDILVVIYCFENDIDLEALLERGVKAFDFKSFGQRKRLRIFVETAVVS